MRRRSHLVCAFEDNLVRRRPPDAAAGFRTFEALYAHARMLGILPPADPLDGIDVDIRLAKALHVREAARKNRTRA